jgi:dTDP-glucose pyrophosphorylase
MTIDNHMDVPLDVYATFTVPDTSTIRKAMEVISANGREVVLIYDSTNRIIGLITDGDIRRGLLSGLTLESPVTSVMTKSFFAVAPEIDRAAVLDIMKARTFQHVPVLDRYGRLIGIHFLRDLIGASPKPNVAVIMAGGQGTRLRPITHKLPKPMVEVAGRPILERTVLHLIGHGIRTIYLSVNYMSEVIERHFGDGAAFGCSIRYLRESSPLGTAGALSLLPSRPEQPFLVLNGDLITNVDISAMINRHVQDQHVATVGVGPYQVQIPFGAVTEREGLLVALEEKPTINIRVNRGIYVLDPIALNYVPVSRECHMTQVLDALLAAKKLVGVFFFDDSWLDVGLPEDLRRARGLMEA